MRLRWPLRAWPPMPGRPPRVSRRLARPNKRGSTRGVDETAVGVLVDWICRRPAEVAADPGWIEVRYSLNDVSTEIRRVGLDLDPGFVPWLGVVLKFVYE